MTAAAHLQDRRQPPDVVRDARARAAAAIAPGGVATNSPYLRTVGEAQIATIDWADGDGTGLDPLGGHLRPTTDGLQTLVTRAGDRERATGGGVHEGAVWQTAAWLRIAERVDPPL